MSENPNVFYVGGSKGGVGKSLFSFALVDYLLNNDKSVLLVDTDTDNPDVFKAHKDLDLPNLVCRLNSLDDADGWADLLDTVQNYPEHTVVINAAARTKTSTASYGEIMKGALQDMQRTLIATATPLSFCIPFRRPLPRRLFMSAAICILEIVSALSCIIRHRPANWWKKTV